MLLFFLLNQFREVVPLKEDAVVDVAAVVPEDVGLHKVRPAGAGPVVPRQVLLLLGVDDSTGMTTTTPVTRTSFLSLNEVEVKGRKFFQNQR